MLIIASNPDRIPALYAIYARLPERGKNQKVTVVEIEDTEILDRNDCDGVYQNGLILLSRNCEEGVTFVHEFGHNVYERSFSYAEQQEWGKFWRLHRKEMPRTGGARCNSEEGFAECYAYYYRGDSWRRKLNVSLQQKISTMLR